MKKHFKDIATYNDQEKTAISVRDGVLEYLGAELNLEPFDKVFRIYRSPATIANAAMKMTGIPVTNEHVDLNSLPSISDGQVISSEMIDVVEDGIATVAIKNKLKLSETFVIIAKENRELSLGYYADLVPHDIYDFEQKDIIPHHLAIVPAGRCGDMCSFIDRKPSELDQMIKFLDADGAVNLEAIAMVMQQLPEAIRKIPVDKLSELVPMLQEMIASAQETIPSDDAETDVETDEVTDESTDEVTDEETEVEDTEKDVESEDAEKDVEVEDEEKEDEEDKGYKDSTSFKDAVAKAVAAEQEKFAVIIDKANTFLDADYSFAGKTANQVMKDCIATQTREIFADNDLAIAFRLLQNTTPVADVSFEDKKSGNLFDLIADKEL
jgi:hypothetical protein